MERAITNLRHRRSLTAITVSAIVTLAGISFFAGYRFQRRSDAKLSEPNANGPPKLFKVQGSSMAPTFLDGDICSVTPTNSRLQAGDIVIANWDDQTHLKRVAAIGGDTVDLVGRRLTVNGIRIEDLILDRRLSEAVATQRIRLPDTKPHWKRIRSDPEWLIYHVSPTDEPDQTVSTADCPDDLQRHPDESSGDRLVLMIMSSESSSADHHRVVFYADGKHYQAWTRDGIASTFEAMKTSPTDDHHPMLNQCHPVAIRISTSEHRLVQLSLFREIEYRDDPNTTYNSYPLTLNSDQLFVVGDNVAISVDSRTVGPIKTEQVLGKVDKLKTADVSTPSTPVPTLLGD